MSCLSGGVWVFCGMATSRDVWHVVIDVPVMQSLWSCGPCRAVARAWCCCHGHSTVEFVLRAQGREREGRAAWGCRRVRRPGLWIPSTQAGTVQRVRAQGVERQAWPLGC